VSVELVVFSKRKERITVLLPSNFSRGMNVPMHEWAFGIYLELGSYTHQQYVCMYVCRGPVPRVLLAAGYGVKNLDTI
jgi:hypothetical protein